MHYQKGTIVYIVAIIAGVVLLACKDISSGSDVLYKDASAPVDARVADLLSRMTLEEKVAQIKSLSEYRLELYDNTLVLDENGEFTGAFKKRLEHGIGEFTRPAGNLLRLNRPDDRGKPESVAEFTNKLQKYVIENTRLGIPLIFHEEGLHGLAAFDATVFPQAIALASTWDTALVRRVYSCIAKETRSVGAQHLLTPVLDVARDLRWGRVEETYGEDPYLAGKIGVACIKGFQGTSNFIDANHVIATIKHFAVHGQPEGGLNASPGNYSERIIREQFLPPFEQAICDAGALSVMAAYSEIDGIPCHANTWLLQDVLRDEWGFKGMVVSDYEGINKLMSDHHLVASLEEAGRVAVSTGVDIELPNEMCYTSLVEQVENGLLDVAVIDRAVSRVLRMKFLTGLFENPYVNPADAGTTLGKEEHAELALEAARESIILLKNEGGKLPLKKDAFKSIALIGPNAKECVLGGYSGSPRYKVGVLEGITEKLGDATEILYAKGCEISVPNPDNPKKHILNDPRDDKEMIDEAVQIARQAELVILVIGGNEHVTSEGGDRNSLQLVGSQNKLLQAIHKANNNVVVVLINGRPVADLYLAENIPAIVECWYGGQETGHAVADVLFGDVNPSGKLPLTVPRSVGDLPAFYYKKPSQNRDYLFTDKTPLFPFGHGLCYTTFEYGNLKLSKAQIAADETVEVAVNLTNTGDVEGKEIVQLYIRDKVSSVTRPVMELKDFAKINLKPGETQTCTFIITPDKLSFLNQDIKRVTEPGEFDIMVGGSSVKLDTVQLVLRNKN